ncbi:MAG: molybdenum cofactor guanylyltransferase [Cytophagaceae bacterium]
MNRKITGVVMTGGQSSRMGSDKGLIMSNGMPWSKLAFNKLRTLGIPALVSINSAQRKNYSTIFSEGLLVDDCVDARGPLGGILSVHKSFPFTDLFILACDMKDMGIEHLQVLYSSWMAGHNEYDIFLYRNEGQPEPLAAIYSAGLLDSLGTAGSQSGNYSMKGIIAKGKVFGLDVTKDMKRHFMNYNSPLELQSSFILPASPLSHIYGEDVQ